MPGERRWIVVLTLLSIPSIPTPATAIPPTSTHHGDPTPITAEALRASLGRRIGQQGFNPLADRNHDGVVSALDAALFRLAQRKGRLPAGSQHPKHDLRRTPGVERQKGDSRNTERIVAGTEQIVVEPVTTALFPGQAGSVLLRLRGNTTPLVGYSLEVSAVPVTGAAGSVTADAVSTNFFDAQNLITACPPAPCPTGATRDPALSMVTDNGNGGVTLDTITADFSTVLAVDGVNDVLAQVFFDAAPDALGDFRVQLGSSSTLIDGQAVAVSFVFTPGTIHVLDPASVPTVSQWGMVVMDVLLVAAGCIVFAKGSRAVG